MNLCEAHAAGLSNTGRVRKENEDSVLLRDADGLWAVADGMGGHQNGKWASQQMGEALDRLALSGDFDADVRSIAEAIHGTNSRILASAEASGRQMGTTVAALYMCADRFAIFWAGDSRIYLCRQGQLYRLTSDHTQVQELVDAGALTPEQAQVHPDRHILSRAVGASRDFELDAIVDSVEPKDIFLLCSDGLTAVVSEPEIQQEMQRNGPEEITETLMRLTLARGAPDNVTIVAVACGTASLQQAGG